MKIKLTTCFGLLSVCVLLSACGSDQNETAAAPEPAQPDAVEVEAVEAPAEDSRPNVLLIVADDLGYTDLGVYGSEIETPNLDALARDGLILTDFHNQAVCAPTRAAILSGTDNRNAGGAMHQTPNQQGVPGYESYLNEDVIAFPKLLQENGYSTYWAGKWHLGRQPHQTPDARGFDRSFALMQGGASHFEDGRGMFEHDRVGIYIENGEPVETLPEGFYSSNFYTDYIIDSLGDGSEQPWFAFLAFTAPHWPLQAPDELIAKYEGAYSEGFEVLRENRIASGKELGVIPMEAEMYPRLLASDTWDSLSDEEKQVSAKKMQLFAAMVDSIDQNIGRLIEHLKATGEYDNTLIMFISDNGAEGAIRNPGDNGTDWTFDNSLENMGRVGSHIYYGDEWAQAGVGVHRYYKSFASEGGTRGPAIIHAPALTKKGQLSDEFISVVDFAPTILELAGIEHPAQREDGRAVQPIQGYSLVPFLFGEAETVRADDFTFGWEIFGHRAIRKGDWKLLWLSSEPAERAQPLAEQADQWGLYNMATDPGEVNDLSESEPEIVEELLAAWDEYIEANGIVLPLHDN